MNTELILAEAPEVEKDALAELIRQDFFSKSSNREKTSIINSVAEALGKERQWIKDVVVNNVGKRGRRISDQRIAEIVGESVKDISIQRVSNDPIVGFVKKQNGGGEMLFASAANLGVGISKLLELPNFSARSAFVILNNGYHGPLSDIDFRRTRSELGKVSIDAAAIHSEGVSHPLTKATWANAQPINAQIGVQIEAFRKELLAKPFLIFTGLSGSGKTRAAREIAHRLAPKERRELVAVGPDWHNRDPLLGYPDGLHHQRYLSNPVLNLILRAGSEEGKEYPHFLILDEMNLSHVERYFADFLSAMETSEESISLYEGPARYLDPESETGEIPEKITIPPNLYVIGTVNVDETTYQFSPKVLDRAHVVEFTMKVGDLKPFFDNPEAAALLPAYSEAEAREFQERAKTQDQEAIQFAADHGTFQSEMEQLFAVMQAHRAEFGYRTLKEASRFLYFSLAQAAEGKEGSPYRDAMDQIILQKLLPKLHGSRGKLEGLLRGLLAYCETSERGDLEKVKEDALAKAKESTSSLDDLGRDESEGHFEKSTAKLRRMCRKLAADQFVSFMEA